MRTRNPLRILLLGFACGWMAPLAKAAAETASDFDAKFAQVPVLYNDRHYLKLEQVLASLARLDGPRTLKAIASLEDSAQERATLVVFGVWAKQDLRAAFAWARENSKGLLESAEFIHACVAARDMAFLDQVLVAVGATRTLDGPPKQSGMRNASQGLILARRMAGEWAKVEPAPIIEWARGLTSRGFSADLQWFALSGIVRVLAQKSPAETFEWLETGIFIDPALDPNRNGPRGLYQAFAEAVIQSSGVEAAEAYFRKQPGKRDYYLAYQPLTEALARTAPERIEQWVAAIEDPGFKSSAASQGIDVIKDTRPDLAADLFIKYYRPPNRTRMLTQLRTMMVTWAAKDAKAALAFVENAPQLTPEHRAALRAAIEPKP